MAAKILIVDDEDLIQWSLSEDLTKAGYKTVTAEDVPSAVAAIEKESPDVVITDLRLGDASGIDVLRAAHRIIPGLPVILMTGFADFGSAVEALREGAADYISKPLQLAGLKITLQRVLETVTLRSRLQVAQRKRRIRYNLDTIVAASPSMKQAVEMARKIAASPFGTVLLLGESGCGKDRLARAIHFESLREAQPLMEINCTAIPEALLESELFGYEKGAFTGAAHQKRGLFELAEGGTVFLNEIGHMPVGLQPKILRFLEEKTFKRVGGTEDISVDVRIVAATNEDLECAIAEKRFRSDLYYRVNVLTIHLLPLRHRREDIMPLIKLLMDRLCQELGKPRPELPAKTLAAMQEYNWPGNVRELRNVIERMLILGETHFQPIASPAQQAAVRAATRENGKSCDLLSLPAGGVRLDDVEKSLVQQALAKSAGNQQKAANLLGIGRDALRRRIEKFGIKAASCVAAMLLGISMASAGLFGGPPEDPNAKDSFRTANAQKAKEFEAKKDAHAPVRQGACSKCHADAKDAKKLTQGDLKMLCLSCHASRAEDLKKASVHSPFKDMDCSACHLPHFSDAPHLLSAPVKELCTTCHDLKDAALSKAHYGVTAMEGECTDCHAPHGSANAKLIKEGKQHVPFASRSCEMCHKATGSDGKPSLKDMPEKSCFVCHSNFRKLGESPVVHPPFLAGQCTACHSPHVSAQPALFRRAMPEVCFTCHDAAGLKDAHPVARHPTSKEGKEDPRRKGKPYNCASCHEAHAGASPKLTRFDVLSMCGECHEK